MFTDVAWYSAETVRALLGSHTVRNSEEDALVGGRACRLFFPRFLSMFASFGGLACEFLFSAFLSHQVRSQDVSLVEYTILPRLDDRQAEYELEVLGHNPKSFKKAWVEFKSKLTGQRALVYVSYTAPYGGAVPILLPGTAQSNQQCPPPVDAPADKSFQGFILALLGHTSAWIIGFSIFIGLLILALILCCSPRFRSGGPDGGMASPGSRSHTPYRGTPIHGSPYGQGAYYGSSTGAYSAGRGTYSSGAYSAYHSAGDTSARSIPEENDDTRREMLTTYRRTKTASRTYLSEDPSHPPGGALPLGRVSPSKSPGLFSVTQ